MINTVWVTARKPNLHTPPVNDFSDEEEVNPAPVVPLEDIRTQFWSTRNVAKIDRPDNVKNFMSRDTLRQNFHYDTRKRFVAQYIVSLLDSPYRNTKVHLTPANQGCVKHCSAAGGFFFKKGLVQGLT